jgi:hypothetical protein
MKQIAQQVRTKLLTLIMAGVATFGFAHLTMAADSAADAKADVGAAAQTGGTAGTMSGAGSANSNAQWQSGATQGADRAAERMSPHGAEMKHSGGAELDATGNAAAKGKR